jgi:hypothetical protein
MPFAGIGLHVIVALICAIHAVRRGQPIYWLFILFAFPLLGSVVYIFAVWIPQSRLQHGASRAVSAAVKVIDPSREVREARAAYDETPTAQNQMRLAAALLAIGQPEEAAQRYEACLSGPFASDPEIRLGAARAYAACGRFADVLRFVEPLRREHPVFKQQDVSLLLARGWAGTGRNDEARAEFAAAAERFGTYEAKAEYAIWAYEHGEPGLADGLNTELEKIAARWNTLARDLNAPVAKRLRAARGR